MLLRTLSLTVLFAVLPGAAFALEVGDLIGTWKVDSDALWETVKSRPEFANMQPEQQNMIKGAMLGRVGAMTWNFTAEGATVSGMHGTKAMEKPKSWTSTGPKTATVVPSDEKQGPIMVELKDDGKLYMTPTAKDPRQKMVIVMKRVAADEAKPVDAATVHVMHEAPAAAP